MLIYFQAYQSICDLLITFSDQLSRSENTNLRSLEYKSTLDEQLVLNNFVQHYVFSLKQEGIYKTQSILKFFMVNFF